MLKAPMPLFLVFLEGGLKIDVPVMVFIISSSIAQDTY